MTPPDTGPATALTWVTVALAPVAPAFCVMSERLSPSRPTTAPWLTRTVALAAFWVTNEWL